jgi:purine-binding chemotaxis protein CheW
LLGLATINDQMIIMVDINELISSDEMGLFERQHEAV